MKKDNLSGFSFFSLTCLPDCKKLLHHQPLKNCTMIPTDVFGVKKPLVPATHKANFEMVAYGAMTNPADRGPRGFFCEWQEQGDTSGHGESLILFQKNAKHYYLYGSITGSDFFKQVFWRILQFLPIDQPSCSCCWHPEICGFLSVQSQFLTKNYLIKFWQQFLHHQFQQFVDLVSLMAGWVLDGFCDFHERHIRAVGATVLVSASEFSRAILHVLSWVFFFIIRIEKHLQ